MPRYWGRLKNLPLSGEGEGNHNVPLGLMAEVGLIGVFCYLGIFYRLTRTCLKFYKSLGDGSAFMKGFALIYLACLVSYLVNMQTLDVRWNMLQNVVVFMMSGMIVAMASKPAAEA
jgi:O-antigen ligase